MKSIKNKAKAEAETKTTKTPVNPNTMALGGSGPSKPSSNRTKDSMLRKSQSCSSQRKKINLFRKLFRRNRSIETKSTAANTDPFPMSKMERQKKNLSRGRGKHALPRPDKCNDIAPNDEANHDDPTMDNNIVTNSTLVSSLSSSNMYCSEELSSNPSKETETGSTQKGGGQNQKASNHDIIETSTDLRTLLSDLTHLEKKEEKVKESCADDCIDEEASYDSSDDEESDDRDTDGDDLSSGIGSSSESGDSGSYEEESDDDDDDDDDDDLSNENKGFTINNFQAVRKYFNSSILWSQKDQPLQQHDKALMDETSTASLSTFQSGQTVPKTKQVMFSFLDSVCG